MKRLSFWICLLVSLDLQVVNGLGVLSLRFISYTNPDGKTSDGNCCEHIFPIFGCAPGDCDPSLQICIHDNTQSGACSNLQYKAGPYDNTESISFGAKIGALQNPVQLPFQVWKSQFVVSIAVYDDDTDGGHDHIGTVNFTPSKSPGYNGTATAYTENVVGGYARLNLVYDVHCLQNFFGDDCTKFCEPDKIHYICDAQGNKVCLQGWTGRNCLLSIDDCHVSACLNFGTCEDLHNTFRCHCSPEFTGNRCETRVNVPNEVTAKESGLSFLLDKITKIPGFTDTPGQETISTEITHLTNYSPTSQTWNSLNLSLSRITTSFPSEELSSVKTESVLRSKNPDEIGFTETNEVAFYSDLTTTKELASSSETGIASTSVGQSNTILSQSFTNDAINVNSIAPGENYNSFISSERDSVSISREKDISNETLSILNRTYTLEYNNNAVSTKEVNLNESLISNELTSLTNTSASETLVTSVVNTISNETVFVGITDDTELEVLQSTLQPLTELQVEFSQNVDHNGLTSAQTFTDLNESTKVSAQTGTENSMEVIRSSTISAQTETQFEIFNPSTTSFKETETKNILEIYVSTSSSKQTDLVTISEQTDFQATDKQADKNTGSFSEGYTSDDLFSAKESAITQRPGNTTGNDTLTALHTKEASLTDGTGNGVTQEAFTSSTLIKTITDNLLTQSTETIENASIVTAVSNRTDFPIIQDTTFESKQTDSAVTTGEGIYITKMSDHSTPSTDDYSSQENVTKVYPEESHSSSSAVEEFESTLIPPILISSSQTKQKFEQVSDKPVSTINTDINVAVDGLQTQTFEKESTTETSFTSRDIVTAEYVENSSVAQSPTLQSSSQKFVVESKTTDYVTKTATVANVDIHYAFQNSSIESTKEQDNKSEVTTATWATLSKSSPSITSTTSVTFSRIFSKTETESSRASTTEVAITDNETTTTRGNGQPSRESSVNSLTASSTSSVLSESIQSTEAETLQSNFSISTKTTIKPTSHSISSPATCLSRYFLDPIGELVVEVNSSFTFSTVKEEMLKILEDYDVYQKEAKFNYTLYSSVYSVWLKFDSRSVPLKMSDLNEISIKVCRTLQNSLSDGPRREPDAGLTSGSLAAITLSMLYLTTLLIIAIFLIHRKHKERNKVGSTPTVNEDSWISKAPIKTSLETEQEC